MQTSPDAVGSASRRQRAYGAVILAASALWTVAGLLIVTAPAGLEAARVYDTAVPAALALLLIGVTGVKRRLGGPDSQAPSWTAGLTAMWRRLDHVLDPSYDHQRDKGLRDVPGTSTATRVGVMTVRAGCIAVVAASVPLATGGAIASWRPTLWFGWFLVYAGVSGIGIAVVTSDELPRWSGALLLIGSLPVFKAATMGVTGLATEPESLGPVVPVALSTPLRVTVAVLLWLVLGAAWAGIGWALRSHGGAARRGTRPDGTG